MALAAWPQGQGAEAPRTVVQQAQQRLRALGYDPGAADGAVGPKTIAALKKFQSDHGQPVSGALDQKTLEALRATSSGQAPVPARQLIDSDHQLHNGDVLPALGGNTGIQIIGGTEISEFHGTAAHEAAKSGNLKKLEALLKANPGLVSGRDDLGYTPLHWAAENGHKDVAELLLTHKADADAEGNGGMTPLHMAAFRGHKEVAELLLAQKVDVNARNPNGNTPLYDAVQNSHKDVAELLLAHGADVMAKCESGNTPLHEAADRGNKDMVELLLANKADVNAKNSSGHTPLGVAHGEQVTELLRQHGGHE